MTALRNLRIIAVPLARPSTRPSKFVPPGGLTYYQFQITAKRKPPPPPTTETNEKSKSWFQLPEEGIMAWAQQKAADTWTGFGKAEGGWKLKTYQFGEKLVDRMDFEELALKSIDPSLGPSISQLKRSPSIDEKGGPQKIPLIFPPSILSSSEVLSELKAYTEHRIPKHKRGFYFWMFVAPLTAPFMIIPVIPNLPFFFCVWRSWSNYRAYRSSQHLESLLLHDIICPEASEVLDAVYRKATLESSEASRSKSPYPPLETLLTREDAASILAAFDFKPNGTSATDLYRAIEQARIRVSRADS